jgi:septal ring factor EnvC (AmiA/AmiB activator)
MGGMPFFHQAVFKNIIRLFLVLGALLAVSAASGMEVREVGVIMVRGLNMRTGPGLDQPVIKILQKEAHVQVLSHHEGWLRVSHDGDVGFIADRERFVTLYKIHTVKDKKRTDIQAAREKARKIRQKIEARQAEIVDYTRREEKIVAALEETEQALADTRKKLRGIQVDLDRVNGEIEKTRGQAADLEKAVEKEKRYALKRLSALYRIKRIGTMNLLASAESMHELLTRKAAMEKILAHDQRLVADLLEKQGQLSAAIETLAAKREQKRDLEAAYAETLAHLEQKKAERERILTEIRSKKANRMATLIYLQNAAARLDQTVSDLQERSAPAANSGKSFAAYQGLLNKPVKGKIIADFGKYIEPRSGVVNFRNGIEIASSAGTPIRAVFPGKTIYADWLKGYGNVVIIAHGSAYHTVYAHAAELFLKKGDQVDTGDVIGTVGDSGALSGTGLYFEIRHQGDPVNPSEWIDNT